MNMTPSPEVINEDRRRILSTTATGAAVADAASLVPSQLAAAAAPDAIRPFRFTASKEALEDLRRRIGATQWPEKETAADFSQGVQLAVIQALARYWATEYDGAKSRRA